MKAFQSLLFDPARARKEVGELRRWLCQNPRLAEKRDILPFFRRRLQLSALIASYSANIVRFDRIAFEYPLFGDFTCDLAVGDSAKNAYCFIEFEDAGPASLFTRRGKKVVREWSTRFDHGSSQLIDWFFALEDMKKSDAFAARFGARSIGYTGILVIGRGQYLLPGESERLEWRRNNLLVASQNIQCVTFDRLHEDLRARLETFALTAKAGG